jgi:hypothetical protein
MSLGSSFPPEYLVAQIRRRLAPGTVIKLCRRMDDGAVREKRFVVLFVDEQTVTCVINSTVSGFIRRRADLLRCQVLMRSESHAFMDHDSHIDCSRTRAYLTDQVIRDLAERPEWILGDVATALRREISAALRFAPTISPAEVALLCRALDKDEPV